MAQMAFVSDYEILATTSKYESERERLTNKLTQMAKLTAGWSFGDGLPISPLAITTANEFVLLAANMELQADVFPNLDGGCAVAFYKEQDKVEVSIDQEGKRFGLRVEHGIGFSFEDVIPPTENADRKTILNYLTCLRIQNERGIWKLSASSISASSTTQASASATLCSGTPKNEITKPLQTAEGGSQSSMQLVLVPATA